MEGGRSRYSSSRIIVGYSGISVTFCSSHSDGICLTWGRRDRLVGRLEWAVYRFWFENLLSGSSSHWSVSPLDTKSTFGLRPSFSQVTLFRGLLKNCLQVNECRNRIR